MAEATFAGRLVRWQRQHGRHDLPWQGADAYRIWLSEVMLQQTQVATVIPYFLRFTDCFPDFATLGDAQEDEVLALWSGLGYYSRARNLHRAAQQVMSRFGGVLPAQFELLQELPGIGRSTAAAICAMAFHQRQAILDGNVKRVLARHGGIDGWPGESKVEAELWRLAEERLPEADVAIYTQGMMDMGATICTRTRPRCESCPVRSDCVAFQSGRVDELPAPRPKKVMPVRQAVFLLARCGDQVLLEKRSPTGIWGGLWSLPQFESVEEALVYCQHNGMEIAHSRELPAFVHTFSHYKLTIHPLHANVSYMPHRVEEGGQLWLDNGKALRAAIPAPVREMLLSLRQ